MQVLCVVLCALFATSHGYFLEGMQTPDQKVRWEPGSVGIGTTQLLEAPMNLTKATNMSWVQVETPENAHYQNVDTYCPEEDFYLFCVFFDQDNGYLAGNQIAIPKANWNTVGDPLLRGYYEWIAPDCEEYYAIAVWIVDEEYLASDATERSEAFDHGQTYQLNKAWLTGPNGTLIELNADTGNTEDNKFTNQTCTPSWGKLMAYELTTESSCENDFPLMPIVTQYNGLGGVVWGDWGGYNGTKSWGGNSNIFEQYWTSETHSSWFTSAPSCYTEYYDTYNITSLTVYFVHSPKRIGCD